MQIPQKESVMEFYSISFIIVVRGMAIWGWSPAMDLMRLVGSQISELLSSGTGHRFVVSQIPYKMELADRNPFFSGVAS